MICAVDPSDRPHFQLAKLLYAAVYAHRRGVGVDYALRNYVKDEHVGPGWLKLAEKIETGFSDRLGDFLAGDKD